MPDQPVFRREHLPAPAPAVWDAVTRSDQLSAWFGAEVDLDLRPGGPARFRGHDGSHRHGLVEEVDPGHRVVFRWWPLGAAGIGATRVEITVEPEVDNRGDHATSILTISETPVASSGPPPRNALLSAGRA
jgi:uncharacterized protein YndB with AHSA1/START domain